MKTQFFNLIILDESGSMSGVTQQTINGCNETINTIISSQKDYPDTQEHFVSIYAFQSGGRPSRYIIKNMPSDKVKHITHEDYEPYGSTPLFDAVGSTLADLKKHTQNLENAVGCITIITDGEENSSKEYTLNHILKMIDELKEKGWSFNFIGANIDANLTAKTFHIDNALQFTCDTKGTDAMWKTERLSRKSYYSRVEESCCACIAPSERVSALKEASKNFFSEEQPKSEDTPSDNERITPDNITTLGENEIFVFGSDLAGAHGGGAARAALQNFGAIMGQGVGLQGQSYAIPTMQGGVETIKPYVDEFVTFAKNNPHLKFFVTRIGCGTAGFKDNEIAPLFHEAMKMENIFLPESFKKAIQDQTTTRLKDLMNILFQE